MAAHWSLVFMVVVGLQMVVGNPQFVWNGDADVDPNVFESLFNEDTQQLKPQKFDKKYRAQPSVVGLMQRQKRQAAKATVDAKAAPPAAVGAAAAAPATAAAAATPAVAAATTGAAGANVAANAAGASGTAAAKQAAGSANATANKAANQAADDSSNLLDVLQSSFLNIVNYVRAQPENAAAVPELDALAQNLAADVAVSSPAGKANSSSTNVPFFHIVQITNSSVYISNDVTRVGRSDQNETLSSKSNASVKSQSGANVAPLKGVAGLPAKGVAAAAAVASKVAAAVPGKAPAAPPAKAGAATSVKAGAAPAPAPAKRARREVREPKVMAFELLFSQNKDQFNEKSFNKRLASSFEEPAGFFPGPFPMDDFVSVTPKPTSAQADQKCQCPKMAEPSVQQPDNGPVIFQPKNVNFFNILPMVFKDKKGNKNTKNTNIFQDKWEDMLDF